MEKVLESSCEECRKIREIMSDPDCIYLKGAKRSPDILYICHKCNEERNEKFSKEKFPEHYARISELKKEGKLFRNNIPIPTYRKDKKKQKN